MIKRRDFFKKALGAVGAFTAGFFLGRATESNVVYLGVGETVGRPHLLPPAVIDREVEWQTLEDGAPFAKITAAKIDGEWVDTSNWTPDQIATLVARGPDFWRAR